MKLGEPVKGFICEKAPKGDVTQFFGENIPLYKTLCSSPGVCLTKGHNGIDIVRPHGTPILAVCGGKVVAVKNDANGYGKHVRIVGEGFEWVYGHLHQIDVVQGEFVHTGTQIGLMGNTGFVVSGNTQYWPDGTNKWLGTHLHLGKRKVTLYSGKGSWNVTYPSGDKGTIEDYDNGSFGSLPIGSNDFVADVRLSQEVEDIIDVIDDLNDTAEKQTDPTIKAAFWQTVQKWLAKLSKMVS